MRMSSRSLLAAGQLGYGSRRLCPAQDGGVPGSAGRRAVLPLARAERSATGTNTDTMHRKRTRRRGRFGPAATRVVGAVERVPANHNILTRTGYGTGAISVS